MNVFRDDSPIPDAIIEKYVQEIVVDKDNFIWKLNPSIGQDKNLLIEMDRNIRKNNISNKTMYHVHSSTGSYCPEVSECYLFSVKLDFEKAKLSHYLQKCK